MQREPSGSCGSSCPPNLGTLILYAMHAYTDVLHVKLLYYETKFQNGRIQ